MIVVVVLLAVLEEVVMAMMVVPLEVVDEAVAVAAKELKSSRNEYVQCDKQGIVAFKKLLRFIITHFNEPLAFRHAKALGILKPNKNSEDRAATFEVNMLSRSNSQEK
ncbi:hypothetical protein DPMN_136766 [Dreissena polymorpha]|uniref:Uncharacterized protein n=1 Tax=Dreissena polymorpha TaxID=45954 RepID=A0A9D4JH17_DREPO|nr:hypothetical protein DPMN_136766 [Dreissena polymorpha]